jgi:hypothetical protein
VHIWDDSGAIIVQMEGLVLRPFGALDAAFTKSFSVPSYPVLPAVTARVDALRVRTAGDIDASALGLGRRALEPVFVPVWAPVFAPVFAPAFAPEYAPLQPLREAGQGVVSS